MRCIVFLSLLCLAVGCSKPDKPKYAGYKNFRIQQITLKNSTVAADLGLYNPNHYTLQLKKADIDVWINQNSLGHIQLDTLIDLVPNDTSYLPLQLKSSNIDLLRNGLNLLVNDSVMVRMEGNVKAGRSGIFINIPVNYQGKHRLNKPVPDSTSDNVHAQAVLPF